jgi:hypothetical protein
MVIGTSRCAHVLCYLFCCRVDRAHLTTRCARPPRMCPVNRRCAALVRKRAAGSLRVRTAARDATTHPAPEGYPLRQQSRRRCPSRSTQLPLEAVRRPTLAFDNQHMSAPVHRCVDAPKPKSRAGSRLSLPSPNCRLEPPDHVCNSLAIPPVIQTVSRPRGRASARLLRQFRPARTVSDPRAQAGPLAGQANHRGCRFANR